MLLPELSRWQHSKEGVTVVKYAPDGTKLAVGTRDSFIDLYSVSNIPTKGARGVDQMVTEYVFNKRLSGHSVRCLSLTKYCVCVD